MSETNNQTRIIHQLITQELERPNNDILTALLTYVNTTPDPTTELAIIACGAIYQHADHLRAFHGTRAALDISRRALEIINLEDALEHEQKAEK